MGQVVNSTTTYLSTLTGANGNMNYHLKLLLENSSTATLIYNNAIKVQGTYSGNFSTGLVALFVNLAGFKFDNVEVYTDGPGIYAPDYSLGPFYYHLNDHLGSTRILTDKNGAVVASLEFYPFGEAKKTTGCSNFIDQRFTGKLQDTESGLQYFGARYLSNNLTRFVSVDPAGHHRRTMPQSWNKYSYSQNDPLNRIDPDGRFDAEAIEWIKAGATAGAGTAIAVGAVVGGTAILAVIVSVEAGNQLSDYLDTTNVLTAADHASIPTAHLKEKKNDKPEREAKLDREAEKEKDMEDIKEGGKKADYVPSGDVQEDAESLQAARDKKGAAHIESMDKTQQKAKIDAKEKAQEHIEQKKTPE